MLKSRNRGRNGYWPSNSEFDYDRDNYDWPCRDMSVFDKKAEIQTFLHYSDPDSDKERTVFGEAKKGLFYNYSDRLFGDKWDAGWKKAFAKEKPKTAAFYEVALKHFHNSTDLNLQHIILGCNRSTGYSYLIFGYTYTSKTNE